MGMGTAAGFVITILDETVKQVAPKEYENLKSCLIRANLTLDELAQAVHYSETAEYGEIESEEIRNMISNEGCDKQNIEETVKKLQEAFFSLTKKFREITGLPLDMIYHDKAEEGDRYDEIDGGVWVTPFNSAYEKTPHAAELKRKYGENLDFRFFTKFG